MLDALENIINYKFKNKSLLTEALTHPSLSCSNTRNYERLEFLGDSVLSLVLTEILMNKFPESNEGDLAKKRSYLVKGESLADIAKEIGLDKYIILSPTEERLGGRANKNILENVVESLLGAMYLDSNFDECKKFISKTWSTLISKVKITPIEPKTFVQEWAQNRGLPFPEYNVTNKTGNDHKPQFTVEIKIQGHLTTTGVGTSKKSAEKKAAQSFINQVINEQR
ncbi:MAG: ribonuclease III [Rickettsiales bacterium]